MINLFPVLGLLVVAHKPALGLLAVLLGDGDSALYDVAVEILRKRPVDDGRGEHVKVRAFTDHIPIVVAAVFRNIVAVLGGMHAAGNLKIGIDFLQRLGRVGKHDERFTPAEKLHVVRHILRHRIAVVVFEALAAHGAVARPVVGHAAGDGGDALGERIVRLVPEESVRLALTGECHAEVLEVVAVGVGVEAGIGEFFSGEGRNLTVFDIVLQELRHLLAAKVLAIAPRIDQNSQTEFVRLVDDGGYVRPPEVEIEFGYGEDHLRDAMRLHFLEVGLRVFDIVETIVAD